MTNEEMFRKVFGITNPKIQFKDMCQCVEKCNGVDCKNCQFDVTRWWDDEYEGEFAGVDDLMRDKKVELLEKVGVYDIECNKFSTDEKCVKCNRTFFDAMTTFIDEVFDTPVMGCSEV